MSLPNSTRQPPTLFPTPQVECTERPGEVGVESEAPCLLPSSALSDHADVAWPGQSLLCAWHQARPLTPGREEWSHSINAQEEKDKVQRS